MGELQTPTMAVRSHLIEIEVPRDRLGYRIVAELTGYRFVRRLDRSPKATKVEMTRTPTIGAAVGLLLHALLQDFAERHDASWRILQRDWDGFQGRRRGFRPGAASLKARMEQTKDEISARIRAFQGAYDKMTALATQLQVPLPPHEEPDLFEAARQDPDQATSPPTPG